MSLAREIAESYWKAECSRDTERILSHYHQDATFCPPGQTLVGHAQIRTFYEASGIDFPGLEVEILNDFAVGNQSAFEWSAKLTSTAGETSVLRGVNIIKIRDGKFEWVHAYFDSSLMQLRGN